MYTDVNSIKELKISNVPAKFMASFSRSSGLQTLCFTSNNVQFLFDNVIDAFLFEIRQIRVCRRTIQAIFVFHKHEQRDQQIAQFVRVGELLYTYTRNEDKN